MKHANNTGVQLFWINCVYQSRKLNFHESHTSAASVWVRPMEDSKV